MKELTKRDKTLYGLLAASVVIMILGIVFLLAAMQVTNMFKGIENALGRYIIVILTMSCGIMLFSNVALNFEQEKLRKGLTIGITVFAFVLTLPLVYVFISLLPFAASHTEQGVLDAIAGVAINDQPAALGLNAVDGIMGVHTIYLGFTDWFGTGGFLWVVLIFMLIVSVVFLGEPLAAGICVVKGKILNIAGKDKETGKFRVLFASELPVLKKQREAAEAAAAPAVDAAA